MVVQLLSLCAYLRRIRFYKRLRLLVKNILYVVLKLGERLFVVVDANVDIQTLSFKRPAKLIIQFR